MAEQDDGLLKTIRKRAKLAFDYWDKQRQRERDDLRFQVGEYQWTDEAKRMRQGGLEGTMVIPPRPMLSVNKLAQPIQQVLNQQRMAKLGVEIHPLSPDADDEVAEIMQGAYRQIERDSNAAVVRSWAFERAVQSGMGYYRIKTTYDESTDDPFDQTFLLERILYQDAVYFDPAAEQPDFSDAEWCILARWLSKEAFQAKYPNAKMTEDMDAEAWDWEGLLRTTPEWVKTDETGERAILVAEYFYKEREKAQAKAPSGQAREREKVRVKQCLVTADEILEKGEWPGEFIPIVTVIGRELQPFDSERRWEGIIRQAKDSQRGYNYAVSQAVESAALEPKAPFQGTIEQFEGYESWYQQANVRSLPYLPYKIHTVAGQPLPPPQRLQADTSKLTLAMTLAQQLSQDLQSVTFQYDPSLGQRSNRQESGIAIQSLQKQGDLANANFLHALADISMTYEAKVILNAMPNVYDRPGRIVRTLGTEDNTEAVMLNAPFYVDPETKMPVAAPVGPDGTYPPAVPLPDGGEAEVKYYDLAKGQYRVNVTVGRSNESQMEQAAEEIGAFIEAMPQFAPAIIPIWLQYRDFPGAKEMAEALRKLRDEQFPALRDEEQPQSKEQLQTQLRQATQMIQMLQQQLQQAGQQIQTDAAKQLGTVEKAKIDADTKMTVAKLQAEIDLIKAQMQTGGKLAEIDSKEREGAADRANDLLLEAQKAAVQQTQFEKMNTNYRGPLKKPLTGDEGV